MENLEKLCEAQARKTKEQFEAITEMIGQLPEGQIESYKKGQNYRIYCTKYINGKRLRSTITEDRDFQIRLARKAMLLNEKKTIADNLQKIESALQNIQQCSMPNRQRFCGKQFPWMDDAMVAAICTDPPESTSENFDSWETIEYRRLQFNGEQRTKLTSRGLFVRSKSEVIIAEKLYEFHIPFHYEELIEKDGIRLAPDFTIKRKDGKMFYWEHEGMMTVEQYESRQRKKSALYRQLDIVPWDNLIVTYDNAQGDIDVRIIESEIKNKLLL